VTFGRRAFVAGIAWISLIIGRRASAVAQLVVVSPLNPSLRATLEAVVDTIVPRDQDPGAVDAGVPARIIAHLATALSDLFTDSSHWRPRPRPPAAL
jgi:gluconate 2-dehydrogenase subunit 3-like protein